MEVILQQDVDKLGRIGDVVRVKPGFARNYLLPRGLAVLADRKNLSVLEHQKRMVASRRAKVKKAAEEVAERLAPVSLILKARAGEEDKLFGSITNQDVARALADAGFEIDRKRIHLDAPIKTLGEFSVPVSLGGDVRVTIKVTVAREEE
jgi:large subunit ribosomal protein L9